MTMTMTIVLMVMMMTMTTDDYLGDDSDINVADDDDYDDNDINVVYDDDLPIPPKGVGSKAALAIGALPAENQHDDHDFFGFHPYLYSPFMSCVDLSRVL